MRSSGGCMRVLSLLFITVFLATPSSLLANKWSDFVVVEKVDGFEISYRARNLDDGWFVEWKGDNKGTEWGAPFSKARSYTCGDGTPQRVEKGHSMGALPPGEDRRVWRDAGLCKGSNIESATIDVEIREVSENVKKMYE